MRNIKCCVHGSAHLEISGSTVIDDDDFVDVTSEADDASDDSDHDASDESHDGIRMI